ncbi:hypothetical protein BpHYR1_028970 [Brachionus plicatilis]|uniref:Uncharacterized protein n=1 Tax=Brachionus plicatilis TaxID=10195 RepID=A0A3M7RUL9_BRAPC|nr:hypothetical protein BpHYR1_028970 [Brachionus plicatilis]
MVKPTINPCNLAQGSDTRLGHHQSKAPPTINILKFIIELFRNFRSISASLHQDPQPLLQLINDNLGSSLSFEIEQMLFTSSITHFIVQTIEIDPYDEGSCGTMMRLTGFVFMLPCTLLTVS